MALFVMPVTLTSKLSLDAAAAAAAAAARPAAAAVVAACLPACPAVTANTFGYGGFDFGKIIYTDTPGLGVDIDSF